MPKASPPHILAHILPRFRALLVSKRLHGILGICIVLVSGSPPSMAASVGQSECAPPGASVLGALPEEIQALDSGLKEFLCEPERTRVESCPDKDWVCGSVTFSTQVSSPHLPYVPALPDPVISNITADIRAGYLPENPSVPFKGNVLYYEGLGDSMMNHKPLFDKLRKAGYRIVSFDYMGQGGSTGKMDNTRIEDIPKIGGLALEKFGRDPKNPGSKLSIIGWSTGGLAAYYESHSEQLAGRAPPKVVLIAPGIAPKLFVGYDHLDLISASTLTHETNYATNPHIDPICPPSPLLAFNFAKSLFDTSIQAQTWKMTGKGFVLLSGNDDSYVDAPKTEQILDAKAQGFTYHQYGGPVPGAPDGAYHEIDNEVPGISVPADKAILKALENQ